MQVFPLIKRLLPVSPFAKRGEQECIANKGREGVFR